MKKAITNVGSSISSSKFVRRVLSKTSNVSKSSNTIAKNPNKNNSKDTSEMDVQSELNVLKEQISKLQMTVNSMQSDSEKKEEAIANLAREKEKLTIDLRKEKRSHNKLKQQLEDEREFYFREKEMFCKEINECKKIKNKLRNGRVKNETKNNKEKHQQINNNNNNIVNNHNNEDLTKLKQTLNQTLEANYNLSVKFLRMKNTKYCLKNRLKKLQTDYEKLRIDTEEVVNKLKKEMKDLCNQHFREPIPPSNKMHIQVLKENSSLLHENLLLRIEIDKLQNELERYKMMDVRKDTKKKLKYIRSKSTPPAIQTTAKSIPKSNPPNESLMKSDDEEQAKADEILVTLNVKEAKNERETKPQEVNNNRREDLLEMIQISENGSNASTDSSIGDLQPVRTQSTPEFTKSLYNFSNS